jgi:predicted outer membrane repeat protein
MKASVVLRTAVIALTLAGMAAITPVSPQAAVIGPEVLMAGIWYVAPGGSDANDCATPTTPCAAIDAPQGKPLFADGDTIRVTTGTYIPSTDVPWVGLAVRLYRPLTLSGGWNGSYTQQVGVSTIDCQNQTRGLLVEADTVTDRITVLNSKSSGISVGSASLMLTRSTVSGSAGEGISVDGGSLTAVDSVISGNKSTYWGAGIYDPNPGGSVTLINSIVSGNVSSRYGGGMSIHCPVTLVNSTVSGNTAKSSGGGIASDSLLTLINSTISGNTAWTSGGGIHQYGGTLSSYNSTIAGNIAYLSGGGIYANASYGAATVNVILQNTIVAGNMGNLAPDCDGNIGSAGYNLIGNTTGCGFTPGAGDQTNVNPRLGKLLGMPDRPPYHPLQAGSPAINAGNPAGCSDSINPLTTDQRGVARAGRCDIGAYEYVTPGSAASIYPIGGTPQRTPPLSSFPAPLQAVVLDSLGSPVPGISVTFAAPSSGASATFEGVNAYTTSTDEGGVATANGRANATSGSYAVTATASGVGAPASFALGNFGWYVAPDGDDSRSCASPGEACATIAGALAKPGFVAGDVVRVAGGTYTGTGDHVVRLSRDAVLSGGWDRSFAAQAGTSVIDGEGARWGIDVKETARVERFTIQNTTVGIANRGNLTLSRSAVINNTAAWFGITNDGGVMTLDHCQVSGIVGGGIFNRPFSSGGGAVLLFNDSTVSGNTDGVGILNDDGAVAIVTRSVINDNKTAGYGAGISNDGMLVLRSSTVSGNTSVAEGGGIENAMFLILENSTVSGNTSGSRGGGISNGYSGRVYLYNSTVAGNTAPAGGGVDASATGPGALTAQNTIIAGNSGGDCGGTLASAGYNLVGSIIGCTFTPAAGDQTNVDPQLGPLEGVPGWHPLLAGSLAIDAGNPAGCTDHAGQLLLADQRGFPRFGRCDVGAYESGVVLRTFLPLIRR